MQHFQSEAGKMDRSQALKIVVLFTLLVATFICTILPLGLRAYILRDHTRQRKRRMRNVISLLNCFTAGVFLGTCLLDLLPDVDKAVREMQEYANLNKKFPLAETIMLFGFLILLTIEQFVTRWKATHDHVDLFHDHHDSHDSGRTAPLMNSYGSLDSYASIPGSLTSSERNQLTAEACTNPLLEDEIEPEERGEPTPDPRQHSVIRPLMLLSALSLHSIFEGLAIGLQKTFSGTLNIFLALTLHKCIIAFSIGLNNVQSQFPLKIILGLDVLFSLMSPIGIALGLGIMNISDPHSVLIATAVLQGIACGTFLYVVFMELLPHEFMAKRNHPDRMLKVLCSLIGIAIVVIIVQFTPEDE